MIRIAAIVGLLLALAAGVQTWRLWHARAQAAEQRATAAESYAKSLKDVADREHASAARAASIAARYQDDVAEIRKATDRIPADIRAGMLRLRDYWQPAASVPATGSSAGRADAAEQRRAQSAARIVRAAKECDAQVAGLQRIVIEDRRLCNGGADVQP